MGEVVELKKKDRLVWVCARCDCMTFVVYEDETMECANCGDITVNDAFWRLPPPPKEPEPFPEAMISVVKGNVSELHKHRFIKEMTDDCIGIIIKRSGAVKTYNNLENIGLYDIEWLQKKLKDALSLFKKERVR